MKKFHQKFFFPALKPVVVPKHQTVDENDVAEIHCTVPDNNEAEISWHRKDGRIFSDDAVDDGHGYLLIKNLKPSDTGEYICRARDPVTYREEEEPATLEILPGIFCCSFFLKILSRIALFLHSSRFNFFTLLVILLEKIVGVMSYVEDFDIG